jgi:hypothetical protein
MLKCTTLYAKETWKTNKQFPVLFIKLCLTCNESKVHRNLLMHVIRVLGLRVMVFKATFNNISVISWRSVLLVEETGVPGENHRLAISHWQTSTHTVVSSTPRLSRIRPRNISGEGHWFVIRKVWNDMKHSNKIHVHAII